MSSLRAKLLVSFVVLSIAAIITGVAAAGTSSWVFTVSDSTYSGTCQLNDNGTPRVCVGTLVSGPGVGPHVRFLGGCPVTLTGNKAIMVCPAGKQ